MPLGQMELAYRAPRRVALRKSKKPLVPKNTKKYVDKKVKAASWSKEQITVIDFDVSSVADQGYLLTHQMLVDIIDNQIFTNGTGQRDTNGNMFYNLRIRIDYIKWQFRFQLGEDETTSAVTQNIRMIIFRHEDQFEELESGATSFFVADDQDGNVDYTLLYGGKKGLYVDKFFYPMSQSVSTGVQAGGNVLTKGYKRLKYVDTFSLKQGGSVGDVQSEKGQLCMTIQADNPTGTNAEQFGYFEIGWRYMNN